MYLGMGVAIGGAGIICTYYPSQSWFFTLVTALFGTVIIFDTYYRWKERKELRTKIYGDGVND